MAEFKYKNYNFHLSSYREFVENFNIFNNQRASAENLNKGINILKKELNQLIGQFKILTSKETIHWIPSEIYNEGEIVTYIPDDAYERDENNNLIEPSQELIKRSYYMALPSKQTNQGFYPNRHPEFWLNVHLEDIYPWLNSEHYLRKDSNLTEWDITEDLDIINLKYLNLRLREFKRTLDAFYETIYIKQDNNIDLRITKDTHLITKKYLDAKITALSNQINSLLTSLQKYVYIDERTDQLRVNRRGNFAWLTPDAGLLPGIHLTSDLGSNHNKFRAIYANDFVGTALKAKWADLAEIYEVDEKVEAGDVLGIDKNGIHKYKKGDRLIGVVSTKPGIIINAYEKGVPVALKGKIFVKIKGSAKKGDLIYADSESIGLGFATPIKHSNDDFIGVCLKNGKELVEVKI